MSVWVYLMVALLKMSVGVFDSGTAQNVWVYLTLTLLKMSGHVLGVASAENVCMCSCSWWCSC